MEEMEQMMIQIWLGQLLASLKEGKVDHVINELETALTRIEEDRDGRTNDNDGQAGTPGGKGSGDTLAIARPEDEHTSRPSGGDAAEDVRKPDPSSAGS